MQMSSKGKALLSQWEGVRNIAYRDAAGLSTIGVGHLLTRKERESGIIIIHGQAVQYSDGLTDPQVMDLLCQDLSKVDACVRDAVKVPLGQGQFDALVSFAFNVGCGAFQKSTLLKILNQGQYAAVPAQLKRWVKTGENISEGLVNRRKNEIVLWNEKGEVA